MDRQDKTNQVSQWVTLYGDYLFSIAMMKTGSKETAEDLVQETFFSAIRSADYFKQLSSAKTWLVSILKNKITDYYRKKNVLSGASSYLDETGDRFDTTFFESKGGHWKKETFPLDWQHGADTALDNKEFQRVLDYCLSKLPRKIRPVFMARFLDEEKSETICKDFAISPSNYWVIVHRAKVLMRSCLETNWFNK